MRFAPARPAIIFTAYNVFLHNTAGAGRLKRQVAGTVTPAQIHIILNQSLIPAMPNKSKTSPELRSVRWTDDEWAQVANHLYSQIETGQFESSHLDELKAKDVFLAQQVLPEGRHRKLVSIAQGFSGVRDKLSTVLKTFPQTNHEDLLCARRLEDENRQQIPQIAVEAHGQARGGSGSVVKTQIEVDRTAETVTADLRTASTDSFATTANPALARRTVGFIGERGEGIAEQTLPSNNEHHKHSDYLLQKVLATTSRATMIPGGASLIEMARPFVATVCEEITKAFFSVMSTEGLSHTLPSSIQTKFDPRTTTQQANPPGPADVVQHVDSCHERPSQSRIGTADPQSEPSRFATPLDDYKADTGEVEVDVQPLFDPKLPPSANSEFKPKIGLVSTHANDFDDLRNLYPQLDLTIVEANTTADVRRFGHCQRIIALHDDLIPSTDELLAEQLRHRYVRLSGGLAALKGQLDAWLQAPGSITTAPRRTVARNSEALDHGMAKKKQNRYPKTIRR